MRTTTLRRGRRTAAGALVALTLAIVPAGTAFAASSKPAPVAKWAHTFCRGFGIWSRDLTQSEMTLAHKVPATASPATRVSGLADYMRNIAAANSKLAFAP